MSLQLADLNILKAILVNTCFFAFIVFLIPKELDKVWFCTSMGFLQNF